MALNQLMEARHIQQSRISEFPSEAMRQHLPLFNVAATLFEAGIDPNAVAAEVTKVLTSTGSNTLDNRLAVTDYLLLMYKTT
jgi:hypothetical protein